MELEGFFNDIVEWFKSLWESIVDFFQGLFGGND